ncbi:ribosome biogenesis GTPase Der [Cesiribacter sp. SM1]|uniref:ribosome biogenesis GTPase Der n=1 Tax=Cesiribacter sp. SM1 TaxID=2861196 RepID=UPI001CD4B52C|nr:ribosome biogenesis GTPase Der [Cesiribacter sp. SM1]
MANIVAIVGRPNVGKSTLFNRLVERRQAIMNNEPGVTRDRHYGYAEWTGKHFTVIDTGGYVEGSEDVFEEAIRRQVKLAVDEASVVLFMVDAQQGLTGLDEEFGKVVRQSKKPVYVVANKADTADSTYHEGEFYKLGLGEVYSVSSATGSGTGDLLDEVVSHFPDEGVENPEEGIPRIAILGRPNVGKSSFLNTLLGVERSIVTDIAGTTRDAINTHYKMFGKDFILVDTAGLRKKNKEKEDVEFFSVLRSLQALQDSDVCIIMIDADRGFEAQDMNIVTLAHRYNKGAVILVNKWDLVEKDSMTAKRLEDSIKERLGPLSYIPIMFISVHKKQRIFQAIELAVEVYENLRKKVPTSQLNEVMLREIEAYPPPATKGKHIKIKYLTQLPGRVPTFALFCNLPQYIKAPYERYLENKMRSHFNFTGVPLRLYFRKK